MLLLALLVSCCNVIIKVDMELSGAYIHCAGTNKDHALNAASAKLLKIYCGYREIVCRFLSHFIETSKHFRLFSQPVPKMIPEIVLSSDGEDEGNGELQPESSEGNGFNALNLLSELDQKRIKDRYRNQLIKTISKETSKFCSFLIEMSDWYKLLPVQYIWPLLNQMV